MARPEQCSDCTKKTTIHFTQILNNKVYKLDMCEDCPFKKQVIDPGNFSMSEVFSQGAASAKTSSTAACPTCGMTHAEFEKRGRLGCPGCYDAFAPAITTLVRDMHIDLAHKGKRPSIALQRINLNTRISDLRQHLAEAIKTEDFEQAATLRDQIIELESEMLTLSRSA
jgi:protein arginine kinase activator